ncbi:MAG: alpha/beta hydrolase [Acidimicrobiia bacterium]|nr:alpha/beta hydrolase [Acidimicrobiia bacterium]
MEPDLSVTGSGGVRLAVRRFGSGDTSPGFLLVHGLASNARTWDGVATRLGDLGHAAVAYDQRGHGRSDRPAGPYDLDAHLEDLAAVLAATGLERPVVAGQSWGGNLAVAFGARSPEAVSGVACVDGGTIDLPARFDDWETCADVLAPPVLDVDIDDAAAMVRARHPDWAEWAVEATVANLEAADGRARNRLPRDAHLTILRAMWDHPPDRDLDRLAAPALFLMADDGDRAPTEERIASVSDARVVWIAGDHDLHLQQPDVVAAHLAGTAWER